MAGPVLQDSAQDRPVPSTSASKRDHRNQEDKTGPVRSRRRVISSPSATPHDRSPRPPETANLHRHRGDRVHVTPCAHRDGCPPRSTEPYLNQAGPPHSPPDGASESQSEGPVNGIREKAKGRLEFALMVAGCNGFNDDTEQPRFNFSMLGCEEAAKG